MKNVVYASFLFLDSPIIHPYDLLWKNFLWGVHFNRTLVIKMMLQIFLLVLPGVISAFVICPWILCFTRCIVDNLWAAKLLRFHFSSSRGLQRVFVILHAWFLRHKIRSSCTNINTFMSLGSFLLCDSIYVFSGYCW